MRDAEAPYLARCREMGIDDLAGFVRDSLERMDEPDPGGDRPRTKDEFVEAWRMLRRKADAMPPDPRPPLTDLGKASDKWYRTYVFLRSPAGRKLSKKERRRIERDQDRLKERIDEMEASGKYDAPPDPGPEKPQQRAARIASEVFKEIELAFERHRQVTGRRLQWRLARPGSLSVGNIKRYYEQRRRHEPDLKYDITRIERAEELGPEDPPWEGPDGFEGYIIYTFPDTSKALMECPEWGNAAYVIHKDWENWSQMDKQQLMAEAAEQGGEVTRIPHTGEDWPAKVRRALGKDRPAAS